MFHDISNSRLKPALYQLDSFHGELGIGVISDTEEQLLKFESKSVLCSMYVGLIKNLLQVYYL